jgi:three-Cys-motif partner protein
MMDTDDPCFIFMDPFGLELKWKTVEELSRKRRIDILVNFPVGAIHRCMTIEGAESTVTECLGCDEWKKFRGKGASVRISLRDLYMKKMQGFFEYTSPKLVYNKKNVPLYYLIYGCHFEVGRKIWEQITKPIRIHTLNGKGWRYYE